MPAVPSIGQMCTWLEVSRSGFYEWRERPAIATAARRDLLKLKIIALFEASDRTYGYRRIHAELLRGGEQAGAELVRRLMRELGLVACQPRPWRQADHDRGQQPAPIPDLVRRDFTADTPGRSSSATSPTSRPGRAGFTWPPSSTATPEVIGYAMADHCRPPWSDAVSMAARNHILVSGAIFIPTAAPNTPPPNSLPCLTNLDMRARSVGPGSVTTTRWPNHSIPRSK